MMRTKNIKIICLAITILLIVACRTNPTSGPSVPGPSSPPGSSVPTPGSGLPPAPGSPSVPGSPTSSKDDSSSKGGAEGSSKESAGDSSDADGSSDEDIGAIPPEWEDDEVPEGKGSSENGAGDSDETSFEETLFEEAEDLSDSELEELEKELDESLDDFDDTLRREQEYAEQNANENVDDDASDGSLSGVGTFESYSGNEGGESNKEQDSFEAVVPNDIPDAQDDDIVARQIREAALKEKDPVLREKLWEEYRKYKKQ